MDLFESNAIIRAWPDGLIAVNATGTIIGIAPKATDILGWSDADACGKNIHQFLCIHTREYHHPESECPLCTPSIDVNHPVSSTYWLKKSGDYLSVDYRQIQINTDDTCKVISFVDNSDRQHNHTELKKFTEYTEKSPTAMAEFDASGGLLFCNSVMNQLMDKFDFDDSGHARVLPKNIQSICNKVINTTDNNSAITVIESTIDGIYFSWKFQSLQSEHDTTVTAYAFDVTELKKTEAQLEENRRQSRKEFYAKMVHELRTPLNAIIGFSTILQTTARTKLSEEELQRLKSIKTAGLQLNDLVTDTLDFSKIESGKMSVDMTDFSIKSLCTDISDQLQTLAESKRLTYRFSANTDGNITSDKTKIRQLILNLASNAIKYTPTGNVELSLHDTHDNELGLGYRLSVTDTGMGIPEEKIASLFNSFEQIDNEHTRDIEGTGLGLALVRNIVDLLGGKITVSSIVNEGSVFDVFLPISSH